MPPTEPFTLVPGAGPRGFHPKHTRALGPTEPSNGFLAYEPILPPSWLTPEDMAYKGGFPIAHLALMHEQIKQLRNALFLARALNRALILPHTICSCEMGFFIYHLQTYGRASDHWVLRYPGVGAGATPAASCDVKHDSAAVKGLLKAVRRAGRATRDRRALRRRGPGCTRL